MLSIATILYIFLLVVVCFGSIFYHPFVGTIGYLATYCVSPSGKWWGEFLSRMGIHYSQIIVLTIMVGAVIHRRRLKFKKYLVSQEILLIIFLGVIWLSIPLGLGFNETQSNALKMTKAIIVLLMASHVITELKRYEAMIWTLIGAGLYLGLEAYTAPAWMFQGGRLNVGIGGSDFSEGNFLGAHFAMLLPFLGVMFLKGGWKSKVICLVTGILVTNGIILCRSRGVFLATLVGAISAIIFSVRGNRLKIVFGLGIAFVGGFILTDPGFWTRMESIDVITPQIDASSEGRILVWGAALSISSEHPLGIGEGNFKTYIGRYNPKMIGRDTHNTFLKCLTELGVQGAVVLLLLIANAFRILFRLKKDIELLPNKTNILWHIYSQKIALITFLVAGLFITHTYIEEFYWLLMFPVFLKRSVEDQIQPLKKR
jgi:putative inorganic carbon (HCO3(-)) transporter